MKGIRISKSGQNVLTAKPEDLYVNTATPLYKVASQDKGTVTFTAAETNNVKPVTINHNLGYEPLFAIYSERQASSGAVRWVDSIGVRFTGDQIYVVAFVNKTQLIIEFVSQPVASPNPAGTYHYYYYIFYNRGDNG